MSFSPSRQRIDPLGLLSDSLAQIAPIYIPLLIVNSPLTIISILQDILAPEKVQTASGRVVAATPPSLAYILVSLIGGLVVTPIVAGTIIYFIYRYFKQGTQDLNGAFQQGSSKSFQFIIGAIAYLIMVAIGLVLLIVPGIYVAVLFGFFPYALITQNYSLIDSFKHSASIVKGRWWQVFGSMLLLLVFFIPIYLAVVVVSVMVGILAVILKIKLGAIAMIGAILGSIVVLFCTPPLNAYYVKLYMRIQEIAGIPARE
jgi:hypothetical protein